MPVSLLEFPTTLILFLQIKGHNVSTYLRRSVNAGGVVNFASLVYTYNYCPESPDVGSQFSLLVGLNYSQNQTLTG